MPLFHLHIRADGELIRDDEGLEFPDLNSATAEAVRSVRSLVGSDVKDGKLSRDLSIDICDADEQLLRTVSFEDAIRGVEARKHGLSANDI